MHRGQVQQVKYIEGHQVQPAHTFTTPHWIPGASFALWVHTRPSLLFPPPRHCSLLARHLNPRPRDRHPPALGSTCNLPKQMSCSVQVFWAQQSGWKASWRKLKFLCLKYMRVYLQQAGPGKASPAKSLALRQHGNSRPPRLYPDVMRRSPMYTDVDWFNCTLLSIYFVFVKLGPGWTSAGGLKWIVSWILGSSSTIQKKNFPFFFRCQSTKWQLEDQRLLPGWLWALSLFIWKQLWYLNFPVIFLMWTAQYNPKCPI